ncbi:hypothetical protein BC937DRAFT_92580 [Endogone sp. FLAS-F59071]|nr:hypothetical protein BC937DRAFT_92580 [Endogone sp. FLAS-F59071]|eukprot:RUS23085.1 hypothetical protein BC937DRAFT_92580 [Endogone sp. FLAS-F59071]
MSLAKLHRAWHELTPSWVSDAADGHRILAAHSSWLLTIDSRYREPQRFYHTTDHIARLLELCDEFAPRIRDRRAVMLAVVFHDIIYDPQASDNEDKSISLYLKYAASIETPVNESDKVVKFIKATESHNIPETYKAELDAAALNDLEYFLDFDLEVLSWKPEDYDRYAIQIRNEYIHLPDEVFRSDRITVLRKLLTKSDRLYYTAEFRSGEEGREERGKKNLEREMAQLEQGDGGDSM